MNRLDNDSAKHFKVEISDSVFSQLQAIKQYITEVKLNPQAAENVVDTIFNDLQSLEIFPERGFLVAERLGRELSTSKQKNRIARALVVGNKKYLALYAIDQEQEIVRVAELVATNTDWASLFF